MNAAMPLTYRDRGSSDIHLEVCCGDVAIGAIRKHFKSTVGGGDQVWHWSLYVSTHPGKRLKDYREYGGLGDY